MADAILADHHLRPPPSDISAGEFDPLPIPPLDSIFLSAQADENLASDLHFSLDDNYDLDITFDDLEEFYFPSENEHFSIPNEFDVSDSIESGSSGISGDRVSDDVGKYLNCSPSESRCSDSGCRSSNSGVQLDTNASPVSSRGSGVSEAMNAGSPDTDSGAIVVDQKVKTEVNVKKCSVPKRKKEEDTNGDARGQKYLRSENSNKKTDVKDSNLDCDGSFVAAGDDDEKRKARLMRNRESAQLSRQRKKHYVEELEDKVRSMHSTIADLNSKVSFFMAENASLRQQLSGNGMCNPQMYPPMAPMPYPWMPCAPYVVKSQGSQVPLVPIPRLKPQQPVSGSKPKKSEGKKGESKSKKVASVSFLGLLFFVLLFGGMVPIVNVKYGGVRENGANGFGFGSDRFYDTQRGRVLMVDGHLNGSHEKTDIDRIHCGGRGRDVRVEHSPNSDSFANLNDSKQLAASLYVPRNDKLVKIDGNLIIHSVLATEKAMASHDAPDMNKNKETSLALPKDFSPALAVPGVHSHSDVSSNRGVHPQRYRTSNEGHNALPSRSSETLKDQLKSSAANGKLQQWFHEGLAEPLLSSGMCTEVFQFDSSPSPGAIVAATTVANITSHRQNATRHTRAKNRRFLHGLQIPLSGSDLNITGEHVPTSQKDKFQGNKSVSSSMVVSVLVDPRENSDTEVDGVIKPKSLSRIFVVVLLDSVKYVTYSCMLPRSGPHLVTT
ncbi:bZIP transcription factor 17 [Euphorbia peplus]|nr:bZIP transcription factor 17 [Euphorbia peplus]